MTTNLIERTTIRKLRIRLLPLLFVLFVLTFIDRINLGFAALTMNSELAHLVKHAIARDFKQKVAPEENSGRKPELLAGDGPRVSGLPAATK